MVSHSLVKALQGLHDYLMLLRDLKALHNFGMVLPRQKIQRKCLVTHSLMKALTVLGNW
jgi:hypothetical protein